MTPGVRGMWLGIVVAAFAAVGVLALRGAVRPPAAPAPPGTVATPSAGQGAPLADPAAFRGLGELAYVAGGRLTLLDAPSDGAAVSVHRALHSGCAQAPAWSADGRWLAFLRYACPLPDHSVPAGGVLAVVAAQGGSVHVLQAWPGAVRPGAFAWSPHGDRLAVAPQTGGLWVVDVAKAVRGAHAARPVVEAGIPVSTPLWSPGGRQIAFARTLPFQKPESRSDVLDTVPAGGGLPTRRFEASAAGILPFGWWPDGRGLLFWLDPAHSASIAADGLPLYSLPLGGSHPRRLLTTPVNPAWLTWSPATGRLLAVAGHTRRVWTDKSLATCDPTRGTCASIPNPPGRVALDPAWSPDGRSIAFVAAVDRGGAGIQSAAAAQRWARTRTLWVERADGSGGRPLPGAGGGASEPAWSRDGGHLLFLRAGALWLVGADGGRPTEIAAPSPANLRHPAAGGPAAAFAWYR